MEKSGMVVLARVRWFRLALLGMAAVLVSAYILTPPENMYSGLTRVLWSPALMPLRLFTSAVGFYAGAIVAMIVLLTAFGRPALAISGTSSAT